KKDASFEDVIEYVLDEFLTRHAPENRVKRRERRKTDKRPKTNNAGAKRSSSTRHIPQAIRDKIYIRDCGKCTYVGITGRRCGATHGLQIDHIKPFARGGTNALGNLRLLCAAHNRLEAERVYGTKMIDRYRRRE
ncbi:MAG: HNH endonuclease, partial [Candidatus Latescibacterota bacterium]